MENDNLALELLTQMKTTIKRLFVVVLLLAFLLFATDEINILLSRCNFTPIEKELFLLRSKGYTLDTISEKLIISRDWAGKLSQKVNKKIIRSL